MFGSPLGLRLQPVFNVNYTAPRTTSSVPIGARSDRTDIFFMPSASLPRSPRGRLIRQLRFIASRFGNQPFACDSRDSVPQLILNLGARIFKRTPIIAGPQPRAIRHARKGAFGLNKLLRAIRSSDCERISAGLSVARITAQFSFHANLDHMAPTTMRTESSPACPLGKNRITGVVPTTWAGPKGRPHRALNVSHALPGPQADDQRSRGGGHRTLVWALNFLRPRWIATKLHLSMPQVIRMPKTARPTVDTILDNRTSPADHSVGIHQGFNLAGTAISLKQKCPSPTCAPAKPRASRIS